MVSNHHLDEGFLHTGLQALCIHPVANESVQSLTVVYC
jgi:hypothetical protein